MKVIKEEIPVDRKTAVELTDKEIALVTNALFNTSENSDELKGNDNLWAEFDDLRIALNIPTIS